MRQELKHMYYFEPKVSVIKKGSPGERTGFKRRRSQNSN